MTPTRPRFTTYAVAGAALLATMAPAVAKADPHSTADRRIDGECRPSATTAGSTTLRTKAGRALGTARLTIETVGDTTTVCGVVAVRKAFRKRATLVTLDLRERSADGADLGRATSIQRATHLSPPKQVSSFVPTGSTFTFKAKIDGAKTARGKVAYTVP